MTGYKEVHSPVRLPPPPTPPISNVTALSVSCVRCTAYIKQHIITQMIVLHICLSVSSTCPPKKHREGFEGARWAAGAAGSSFNNSANTCTGRNSNICACSSFSNSWNGEQIYIGCVHMRLCKTGFILLLVLLPNRILWLQLKCYSPDSLP